ncbi:MAG: two-component regulator propeller domain-containing protein [Bacteroidota bacterium]
MLKCFKKYWILIIWIFVSLNANSQNSYLSFNHIGVDQGLSDMKVNTIVQDKMGFIWVGTDFGLNRYDGRKFFQYTNDPDNVHSLSSNIVSSLFIDKYGNLWVGTNKGLNFYEYTSGKIYQFAKSAFSNSKITAINADSKGNIIIASTDKGLFFANIDGVIKAKKNNKKVKFKNLNKEKGLIDNFVRALHKDQSGNLWIGTNKGLNYFISERGVIETKQINDTIFNFFKNKRITSINSSIINNNEIIWCGTSNGLHYFNKKDKVIRAYFNEKSLIFNKRYITKVLTQHDTIIWVGRLGGGLIKINFLTKKVSAYDIKPDDEHSIASSLITTLFIDKNKLIWAGVGGAGLDVANTGKSVFENYLFRTPTYGKKQMASYFIEDQDQNLIIATYYGLIRFDIRTDQITSLIHFSWISADEEAISPHKIIRDKKGNFWIASFGKGLFLYDKNFKLVKHFKNEAGVKNSLSNNYIYSILFDKTGNLYIGTRKGLNILDPETNTFNIYENDPNNPKALSSPYVTALAESDNGTLWLGTWGSGIYKFNKKNKSFESFKFDKNEGNLNINNNISQILPVGDSILWLATANGIKRFNINKQQTENYTIENGLQSRVTNGIVLKGKQLWISSGSGISVLNTENKSLTNFTKSGNLFIGNLIRQSRLLHSSGDIYFGGNYGFVKVKPSNINLISAKNKTVVSDFFVFGKSISLKKAISKPVFLMDTITISTADKVIAIELTTPNFLYPENIKYKYKLEGLNDDFIELSKEEHTIGFSNLGYGEYHLIIKSSMKEDIWRQEQKIITLIVEPRIWQTTWFKITSILLIIFVVYYVYRRRLVNIKRQNEKLDLLVKHKTKELKKSMNTLFEQREKLKEINIELEEKQEEITQQAEEVNTFSEKLRESNTNLEKKVKTRTKELNIALGKAEDSRRLISAFLENMSHEIRTPMNAISGFSQLIVQQDISATQMAEYAEIIINNVDSLLDLINNVMDASKLHAGQYKFSNSIFNLNSLFKLTYDKLVNEKGLKKEAVDFSLALANNEKFMLSSDKNAFTQVIYNLTENALKYTEKGSVKFGYKLRSNKIKTEEDFTNSYYEINTKKKDLELEIFAKDTGSGISEKEQQIIFDLFRKLENKKDKLYRGSGLGLAIVNNLSVKLHAKIKLKSEINSGTYISLTIPLYKI